MRAILFSGGVESTALLTMADKEDVLLLVEPYRGAYVTFLAHKALKVAAYFGNRVEFLKPPFFDPAGNTFEDFPMLLPLASIWVGTRPGYKNVWFGANSTDWPQPHRRERWERMLAAFNLAHPDCNLQTPLRHLTKLQQWELIPASVRPLVHTCNRQTVCGKCGKCLERLREGVPL